MSSLKEYSRERPQNIKGEEKMEENFAWRTGDSLQLG
jgi:hypothetical protein